MEVFDLLGGVYAAFNARDVDRVLAAMHPDVDWPNGMEGGYVHGRDAVRDYWTVAIDRSARRATALRPRRRRAHHRPCPSDRAGPGGPRRHGPDGPTRLPPGTRCDPAHGEHEGSGRAQPATIP